ncbi:hypothetical protein JRO89_XS13G0165900 [Xanthoceras sorbifolium]|uniref:Zinc knuckle CX2CX4HX4C domain-containing protein n=1 Tax=Xanthoceras sorbifolium TaxID=99658 RepID=A0ABQ8H8U0_9ROSI|nr:hypothetical protein JRO89_XS13G0165900 [Xanthoceras sorbifolium]
MTKEIGIFLGKQVGLVREIDLGATRDCYEKFLRIRISIDIQQLLRRCIYIDLDGLGKVTSMLLKYERLSEFSFHCGLLGHATRKCLEIDRKVIGGSQSFDYGGWMRATSPIRARKNNDTNTTSTNTRSPTHANTNFVGNKVQTAAGISDQTSCRSIPTPSENSNLEARGHMKSISAKSGIQLSAKELVQ